jgi:hypothetical protein
MEHLITFTYLQYRLLAFVSHAWQRQSVGEIATSAAQQLSGGGGTTHWQTGVFSATRLREIGGTVERKED